jgi:hypothetical protein
MEKVSKLTPLLNKYKASMKADIAIFIKNCLGGVVIAAVSRTGDRGFDTRCGVGFYLRYLCIAVLLSFGKIND